MAQEAPRVQSVQRAIEIIEFVSERPRSQSEVADHIDVRSTAQRLMETLIQGGLIRRSEQGLYSVGYRIVGLAHQAADQFSLANLAHPVLVKLGASCGHTIHLAELTGERILYADKIDPVRSVRLYSQIGQPVPFHTSGVAKAILVFQPEAFVDEVLKSYAATTIADARA